MKHNIIFIAILWVVSYHHFPINALGEYHLSNSILTNGISVQSNSSFQLSSTSGQPIIGNSSYESFDIYSGLCYPLSSYLMPIIEIRPPFNLHATDVPDDNGYHIKLTWTLSPDDASLSYYAVYRSRKQEITDPITIESFSTLDDLIEAELDHTILVDTVNAGENIFIDSTVPLNDVNYYYWITAVTETGKASKPASLINGPTLVDNGQLPKQFRLVGTYPNPFNPTTSIIYEIPDYSHVKLTIYDTLGREVTVLTDTFVSSGTYEVLWDGRNYRGETVGSGVYIYQLIAGSNKAHSKVMFLR